MIKPLLVHCIVISLLAISIPATDAQPLYFPSTNGDWEQVDPASIGWDPTLLSAALDVAGARRSSARCLGPGYPGVRGRSGLGVGAPWGRSGVPGGLRNRPL